MINLQAAAIDIGTNSSRLLIGELNCQENGINILERELQITRLGEGVDANKKLTKNAVNRVIKAIREYKNIMDKYDLKSIRVVGTSALRDVHNSEILTKEIKEIGFELQIISGEKEAQLNFLGAASSLKDQFLLLDIGGGSTEFIWPADKEINYKSLDIGCVRMTERFINNPEAEVSEEEIKNIEEFTLDLLSKELDLPQNLRLKGVGGTITTLAAVKHRMAVYDSSKIEGSKLNVFELNDFLTDFKDMNLVERSQVKGLQAERADIITAGLVILISILNFCACNNLTVSDKDLLYGLLKEQLF
ncbi:Ppx/GppA phosphatase [Halanaerobium hydrogeniformans]|uniref:Ppx/GppA phosphatase n=1 Tax=Halanaerobium hydrogeniformans TaxID=656519 RepID=E4RJG6_HALHG|nr:Ppx/GppA phosphatase [Halanaerobium hydrogeniformans]